ncbi:MAG: polyprenyl synthetase family protein [Elusimicrobiota bacterium]|jgi:geranylgeranyl diphosphate synthase type II|nr:polyprenyl synthetase family protein [Elusimicrobiota bacterium]
MDNKSSSAPIFLACLNKNAKLIDKTLKNHLPKDRSLISRSMSYAVLNGGKRLRPTLVILAAQLFSQKISGVLPAAAALEFVHCYSLVHDDLPSMDNDDLRRGKPTVHKQFGEAVAVLCGDALLTESFNLIAKSTAKEKNIAEAVMILSKYAGYKGMIGGQTEDTVETGKWRAKDKKTLSAKLKYIQLQKTGALISAALKVGAVLSGADKKSLAVLESYGNNIGCAFQITDDLLDVFADKTKLGKRGSDQDNNKLTAFSLYGKDKAWELATRHIKTAKSKIKFFGKKAIALEGLADFILERDY